MVHNRRSTGTSSVVLVFLAFLSAGCASREEISDFDSDGCSLFPDRSWVNEDDWCDCCVNHDIAYWKGGTEAERREADEALRQCVLDRTSDENLAALMFEAVRLGGGPGLPTWYRWGYGWPLDRGYRALTAAEEAMARKKLKRYFDTHPDGPCREGRDGH